MKAVMIKSPYQVVVEEVEQQEVGDLDVKIQVVAAGICGSDIHAYKGLHPFRKPPVIIGHEICGKVVEVGNKVSRIRVGDRVTVEPQFCCGSCENCLRGESNYCEKRTAPGIGKWYGTMAEFFVTPEQTVFVLPDQVDYHQGALVEPLAVGVHAVRKANIQVGDRIAVLGSGPIGLLALAAARAAGATTILATDVMDYSLTAARAYGATHTLNINDNPDWVHLAKEMVGGAFDKVLVAVGVPGIVNQSLALLRKGGRAVTIAMFHGEQALNIIDLQGMEKEIVGSFTYTREDTQTAIDLLATGVVHSDTIITHVLPCSEAAEGFRLVDKKEDESLKILITF